MNRPFEAMACLIMKLVVGLSSGLQPIIRVLEAIRIDIEHGWTGSKFRPATMAKHPGKAIKIGVHLRKT